MSGFKSKGTQVSMFRERLSRRPTRAEIQFKEILEKYDLRYKFQKVVSIYYKNIKALELKKYIVDFQIVTKPRLIIEIDGGYHTSDWRQIEKDNLRAHLVKRACGDGYEFLRIRNEEVFDGRAEEKIRSLYPKKHLLFRGEIPLSVTDAELRNYCYAQERKLRQKSSV